MRRVILLCLGFLLAACSPTDAPIPTIAPTLTPLPTPLTLGQPVQGTLTLSDRLTEWQVSVPGGAYTAAVSGTGLQLTLFDADGAQLMQGNPLTFTAAVAGTYTLRAQLISGETADYTLSLDTATSDSAQPPPTTGTAMIAASPTPTPPVFAIFAAEPVPISANRATFGAINAPDERHVYTFEAQAGTFVRARMERTSGTLNPYLTLYTPDGTLLAVDDNSGGGRSAQLNGVRLPQAGVYTLVADGKQQTGTYEITLTTAPEPFPVTPMAAANAPGNTPPTPEPIVLTPTIQAGIPGNRLDDHTPIRGSIDRAGAVSRYVVQADAGETFTVGVRTLDESLQPALEMSSPSGAIAASETVVGAEGEVVINSFEAPTTGAYVIFVTGQADTTGAFTLSYGRGATRETIRQGETFPDRTYDAAMLRRAVRHDWYLRLNAGDMITASVASTDGRFDPVLMLVGPGNNRIIQDDNSGDDRNAQIRSVRAPQTGVYTLRVTSADPQIFGLYSLVWRYIEAAPTPTPPLLTVDLFTVDDIISPQQPLDYPVQGTAGERLLIEVEAAPGSGLDTVVELLNEAGEVVASDDDSGGGLNPELLANIPADGLYQVRVQVYNDGNNTGGPFVLRVKRVF